MDKIAEFENVSLFYQFVIPLDEVSEVSKLRQVYSLWRQKNSRIHPVVVVVVVPPEKTFRYKNQEQDRKHKNGVARRGRRGYPRSKNDTWVSDPTLLMAMIFRCA